MLTAAQERILTSWGVDDLIPVGGHRHVWWGTRGDESVVVKTGDVRARQREAAALAAFGGGCARLVGSDPETGTLVVERLLPGDDALPLSVHDDDAATRVLAGIADRLHAGAAIAELPALAEIGVAFDGREDPRLPRAVRARARAVFGELVVDQPNCVVLHGDLHHMNALRAGDDWRAIDPHGWIGDPAFEAAALLANPRGLVDGGDARGMDGTGLARRSRRRAQIYAEARGLDIARVRAWGFVGCVIAELWMLEDHDLVHGAPLAVAEALMDDV